MFFVLLNLFLSFCEFKCVFVVSSLIKFWIEALDYHLFFVLFEKFDYIHIW